MALVSGLVTATAAPTAAPPFGDERRAILFYTAEVHGAVEPCGCTSDPLGDISRLVALMEDTRREMGRPQMGRKEIENARREPKQRGGVLPDTGVALVDAGGLLYPEGSISAKERPSANLRAEFLAAQYERVGLLGATLGETDVRSGPAGVRPLRLASNLDGPSPIVRPAHVAKVGGIAIGVLGIADPAAANAVGAKSEDVAVAARRDVERLRNAGAEVVVLLAALDKAGARKLARDADADVVVIGKRVGPGMPRMERVGRTFVVAPADELQRVGRLEIVLRAPGTAGARADLQDGGGPQVTQLRRDEIDRTLERLRVGLAKWTGSGVGGAARAAGAGAAESGGPSGATDETTDRAFVAAKQQEKTDLEAERKRLETPWVPPATGNYVVNELIPLRRSLRRDGAVVAAMKKLDQRVAAVNLKQATPPPPPEPERPFFVGTARCVGCHTAATKFWKKTVHAHAWKTLVDGGKHADYKCVGCHVTGFGQVGGSSLGFTKNLESVQCETCHGPGSAHVTGEGNEEPLAVRRDTPETVCLGCHNEQHSDTFVYEPYLRDIVGRGHGPKLREKLGPGVTGHELRTAAVSKAKLAGAAQVQQGKQRPRKSGGGGGGGRIKKM